MSERSYREKRSFQTREFAATWIGMALVAGVPFVVLLVMLYASAMLSIFGDHHVHAQLWGWLSHHRHVNGYVDYKGERHNGYTEWTLNETGPRYMISVVTAYLIYQLGEGLFQGGRYFARYLAK